MVHIDLFSGIGGFAYAAQCVWGDNYKPLLFCEIDKFCQKVLKKHWPNTPICKDVKELNNEWINTASDNRELGKEIDLLTGGFPCQPFSQAGLRRGKDDTRYLWPEMLRVIRETRPRWIIGENVAGFVDLGYDQAVSGLEDAGYEVQSFVIPACAVGAPHRRDRVWIVANACGVGQMDWRGKRQHLSEERPDAFIGTNLGSFAQEKITATTPDWSKPVEDVIAGFCRMDDGISNRMDRFRVLGNAIVPQVAMIIMSAIKIIDETE